MRGALLHHLYQHGTQKRCTLRREHPPPPRVAEGLHRLPGGLVQRGLQHIRGAVYTVCCNGIEQRRHLHGRSQQTALPKAEICQLAALRQLLQGRQLPCLGGKSFCQRQALPKAESLGGVQQFFRAQLLPQTDKIAVAAFFQRSGKVYLSMGYPARAAEDLPIHHHCAGALENRLQARFQRSRRKHRLEHRAHCVALQWPIQEGTVLCLQAVGKVLRVVARQADAGAHRCCGGIQHQNAAACHGACRHCLHRPLRRAGDGQLHA